MRKQHIILFKTRIPKRIRETFLPFTESLAFLKIYTEYLLSETTIDKNKLSLFLSQWGERFGQKVIEKSEKSNNFSKTA